jgi:hypothetical protein
LELRQESRFRRPREGEKGEPVSPRTLQRRSRLTWGEQDPETAEAVTINLSASRHHHPVEHAVVGHRAVVFDSLLATLDYVQSEWLSGSPSALRRPDGQRLIAPAGLRGRSSERP